MGRERLFEARKLDDDRALVDAGLEGLDLSASCEELAAAGLDRRPASFAYAASASGFLISR